MICAEDVKVCEHTMWWLKINIKCTFNSISKAWSFPVRWHFFREDHGEDCFNFCLFQKGILWKEGMEFWNVSLKFHYIDKFSQSLQKYMVLWTVMLYGLEAVWYFRGTYHLYWGWRGNLYAKNKQEHANSWAWLTLRLQFD